MGSCLLDQVQVEGSSKLERHAHQPAERGRPTCWKGKPGGEKAQKSDERVGHLLLWLVRPGFIALTSHTRIHAHTL